MYDIYRIPKQTNKQTNNSLQGTASPVEKETFQRSLLSAQLANNGKKAGEDAPPVQLGWDSHQAVVSNVDIIELVHTYFCCVLVPFLNHHIVLIVLLYYYYITTFSLTQPTTNNPFHLSYSAQKTNNRTRHPTPSSDQETVPMVTTPCVHASNQ